MEKESFGVSFRILVNETLYVDDSALIFGYVLLLFLDCFSICKSSIIPILCSRNNKRDIWIVFATTFTGIIVIYSDDYGQKPLNSVNCALVCNATNATEQEFVALILSKKTQTECVNRAFTDICLLRRNTNLSVSPKAIFTYLSAIMELSARKSSPNFRIIPVFAEKDKIMVICRFIQKLSGEQLINQKEQNPSRHKILSCSVWFSNLHSRNME